MLKLVGSEDSGKKFKILPKAEYTAKAWELNANATFVRIKFSKGLEVSGFLDKRTNTIYLQVDAVEWLLGEVAK